MTIAEQLPPDPEARAPRNLVPPALALPDVLPTDRLTERAVPKPELRAELRAIPNVANVFTTAGALAQSFGVVAAAAAINTWWSYGAAFVLMGRGHAVLNILAHEAAHRLLFTNRTANDLVGRFLLGYPTFQPTLAYRRGHFAHHKDEMGPADPDNSLYSGYPVPPDSWRRKLTRDATGRSAVKVMGGLVKAVRGGSTEARQVIATHAVMIGLCVVTGRPLAYVVWLGSWSTLWRVINRLRAIAEHGGMERSRDRRETTHVIRQSRLARYWMVPYNTGWHLAHHVDMGVPWRKLPQLHDELVAAGWVTPDIEYPSYRAFWRAATSGAPTPPAT